MADKPFIPVKLNTEPVDALLARVQQATGNLAPLMVGGRLQPEAQAAIVKLAEDHLHRAATGEG